VDRIVAVVAALRNGQEQLGSGYLVSGRMVLTAEHCVRDNVTGQPAARLRVIRASDGAAADVVDVVPDEELDVAVLRLADDAPWDPDLPLPTMARVDQSQSGVLDDCTGIGFPLFQRDPDLWTRHTSEFHGRIYQTDERESGHLLMREPLIHPGPVTAPEGESLGKRGRSPWGGLSGALIFHRESAIGVVVEHHTRQGDSALRAIGFERIAHSLKIRQCLSLPEPDKLPCVSQQVAALALTATPQSPPMEIPPDTAFFTGRSRELAALRRQLTRRGRKQGNAVVINAVAGKPGIGKSTLAVHAAHELAGDFPDGQLYINLRGADDQPLGAETALEDLLRRFGMSGESLPRTLDGKAAAYRRYVAGKRMLVVLDNAASEQQVRPLLPGAPPCAVIVTSRQILAALDAAQLGLEVLSQTAAMKLLGKVAGSARLRKEPEATARVAELCGFMPLALRIAGAKLAVDSDWTVARLAELLTDERQRLAKLSEGDLDVCTSFAASWHDLPDRDARAFRLLGVIPGLDFDSLAAAAVLDIDPEAADAQLGRLARLNLLEHAPGYGCYRFHDLLRLYARERLEADESPADKRAAFDRLLEAYCDLAEFHEASVITPYFSPPAPGLAYFHLDDVRNRSKGHRFASFEAERENLLAVVEAACQAGEWGWAWRIAERLTDFLFLRGYWNDCERTAFITLHAIGAADTWGRRENYSYVKAYICLARICSRQGRWHECIKYLEDLLDGGSQPPLGAADTFGEIEYELGNAYAALKNWSEAQSHYLASILFFRDRGYTRAATMNLLGLGNICRARGRWKDANVYLEACLQRFQAGNDHEGQALAALELGHLSSDQGELATALHWWEQSLASWHEFEKNEFGNKSGEAVVLNSMGTIYRRQHRWDDAIAVHKQALSTFRKLGILNEEAQALINIAVVYADQGCAADAALYCEEAVEIVRELDTRDEGLLKQAAEIGSSAAAYTLGLLIEDEDPSQAESWYRRAAEAGRIDAAVNLGVLVHGRDPAEAEHWYRIAAGGGDADGQRNLAILLLERGGPLDEAERWLRMAAGVGDHQAESTLGSLLARLDRHDEARKWWNKAEGPLRDAVKTGDQNAVSSLAELLYAQGRLEEAEPWFRKVAEVGTPLAQSNLGTLLYHQGRLEGAELWFRKAADAGFSPATSYLEVVRKDRSAAVLGEWLNQAPDWAASAAYLSQHMQVLSDPLATELLVAACTQATNDSNLWRHLGLLLLDDQAVTAYAAVERNEPNPFQQATSLIADGDTEGAFAWSCLARAAEPGPGALLMGQVQILLNNIDWAREALAAATDEASQDGIADVLVTYGDLLAAQPSHAWLHAEHAAALERAGKTSEAVAAHEQAIALDPDNPSLHMNKGELLFSLSRLDEAQAELLTVTRLRPDDVLGAAVMLAAIEWSTNTDHARDHLRDALASPSKQVMPYPRAFYRAIALAGLGRPTEAFAELKAAATARSQRDLRNVDSDKALLKRFDQPKLPGLNILLRLL
jgi:TPR repeat protein/Mrp family chromosome partitioning ATPase